MIKKRIGSKNARTDGRTDGRINVNVAVKHYKTNNYYFLLRPSILFNFYNTFTLMEYCEKNQTELDS